MIVLSTSSFHALPSLLLLSCMKPYAVRDTGRLLGRVLCGGPSDPESYVAACLV